jgi:triacylglycerol lipase
MVHSGFYFAANSVWSPMIKLMGRLWKAGDVVWVAGHSLGGAMATLAARWVVAEKYDVAGVFTFGQPRVGDNDYADNYPLDDIHYRFVNDKDFVPQVPYRWMGPGVYYKHVGKPYIFDADGNLSRAEREWNSLVRDFASDMLVRGPGAARLPVYNFEDHALERYIERIEAALAE